MKRVFLRSIVCASTILALLSLAAVANATTVAYNGATVIVAGGDSAAHTLQFRLSGDQAHDEILDDVGFTSTPGDCTFVVNPTWISCPAHTDVQVDLGSGNDTVTFAGTNFDCFAGYVLNLGDGANHLTLSSDCPQLAGSTAAISSGSGSDVITEGSQSAATVSAGGGDDSVYGGPGTDVLHGGEGNDRLFGYAGDDQVLGEGGDDAPNGGIGNDLVDGGPGTDALESCAACVGSGNDTGMGADAYVGGAGTDKLWLDGHAGGVAITIDGLANDGLAGEGDNVGTDIEAIEGTAGNDSFVGSPGPDAFSAGAGNDVVHGADGADDLYGGGGDDQLFGDAGVDKVQGAGGADTVDGGAGADQLYGDVASCSVSCSSDSDTLLARDGEVDAVDCGGGADSATVDFADVVAGCASIDRSAQPVVVGPPPPAHPPQPAAAKPRILIPASISARALLRYGLVTKLSCPGRCRAAGTVRIRTTVLAGGRAALNRAGATKVVLKVTPRAIARIRALRRTKLAVRVIVTVAGRTTIATRAVTFVP
ncbi:MAG: Hemolysin-type calcium-binding region [Thermoleophilia bacterium]|nr:Hemolysin-type calcium-binding region [Thermoleophilia bacterium]